MTDKNSTNPVIMPDNTNLLDWDVQSTVNAILENPPDEDIDQSVIEFLKNSSHEERLRIGFLIDEKVIGPRHLVEAIIDQIVNESHEDLKNVLTGDMELPQVDTMALQAMNERRIYRSILSLPINQLLSSMPGTQGRMFQQRLLILSLEQQEAADQAINNSVQQHQKSIQALGQDILQSALDTLYPPVSK